MTGTENLPTSSASTTGEAMPDVVPLPEPVETMATQTSAPTWAASQWHGRLLVDADGKRIGKLQDVYVDVETDEPMFATVKEGLWPGRHLTFVPLLDVQVEPEELHVPVSADLVSSAPDLDLHGQELSQADESALYHHFQQNYVPPATPSGRRLARR
jgi:hypothetical protein